MTIRFQDFAEGRLENLKHAPGLVLGWLKTDLTGPDGQEEIRYAVYADGRKFQADPGPLVGPGSTDFVRRGRKWTPVQAVPADAEFIGHYKPPV